jgi:hypothetical protein
VRAYVLDTSAIDTLCFEAMPGRIGLDDRDHRPANLYIRVHHVFIDPDGLDIRDDPQRVGEDHRTARTRRCMTLSMRDATTPETGCISGMEGQWVVVHKDRVVACDYDAEKMFRLAEQYPEDEVVVSKVLYDGASFY